MKQKSLKYLNFYLIVLLFFTNQYSYAQTSNLWITLNPNAGDVAQVDEDITVNNWS